MKKNKPGQGRKPLTYDTVRKTIPAALWPEFEEKIKRYQKDLKTAAA